MNRFRPLAGPVATSTSGCRGSGSFISTPSTIGRACRRASDGPRRSPTPRRGEIDMLRSLLSGLDVGRLRRADSPEIASLLQSEEFRSATTQLATQLGRDADSVDTEATGYVRGI